MFGECQHIYGDEVDNQTEYGCKVFLQAEFQRRSVYRWVIYGRRLQAGYIL